MTDLGPLPLRPEPGRCPACGGVDLRRLVEQTAPVHTSKLLADRAEAIAYPRGVIRLEICASCGLMTNSAFDAPGHDYSASYEETQAFSARFMEYARDLAGQLVERHALEGRPVLEIGCGRGDFLQLLCEATGGAGVGIDPSWRFEELEGPAGGRITVTKSVLRAGSRRSRLRRSSPAATRSSTSMRSRSSSQSYGPRWTGSRRRRSSSRSRTRGASCARRRSGTSSTSTAPTSPPARSHGPSGRRASRRRRSSSGSTTSTSC